jgi:hypothetical protein
MLPCFLAGTQIATFNSTEPIENIKVGDRVKSYDLNKGRTVESVVTKIYTKQADHYYIINGKIKVTAEHPFYTNGGWVKVKDLKKGMMLFNGSEQVPITTIERIDEPVEVYNLKVNKYHNYFAEGILVHNKNIPTLKVGIGTDSPANTLDVAGQMAVGSGYAGIGPAAPSNGMIVEGNVGIGTMNTIRKITCKR